MATAIVNKNKAGKIDATIIVDDNMRDYSNDPFFVKKAEKATAFLQKHGLPKSAKKK
jgi:hypothetical protein